MINNVMLALVKQTLDFGSVVPHRGELPFQLCIEDVVGRELFQLLPPRWKYERVKEHLECRS